MKSKEEKKKGKRGGSRPNTGGARPNSGYDPFINDGLIETICSMAKYSMRTIADFLGLGESTIENWLTKGKKTRKRAEDDIYRRFWIAWRKARAEIRMEVQNLIYEKAKNGDLQATFWIAHRIFGKEDPDFQEHKKQVDVGGEIKIKFVEEKKKK